MKIFIATSTFGVFSDKPIKLLKKNGFEISLNKKKVYKKKKDIVGVSINPQFPKNPHIIIDNTFDKNLDILVSELQLKIKKITLKKNYEF